MLQSLRQRTISQANHSYLISTTHILPNFNFFCGRIEIGEKIRKRFASTCYCVCPDYVVCPDLQNGKVIKVFHLNTLMDLFPNFDFGGDGRVEDHNDSIQSSY